MDIDTKQERAYRQNLIDAGCPTEEIQKCLDLLRKNDTSSTLKLLDGYRAELLASVHKEQKQLDCLDYFVYRLKKES